MSTNLGTRPPDQNDRLRAIGSPHAQRTSRAIPKAFLQAAATPESPSACDLRMIPVVLPYKIMSATTQRAECIPMQGTGMSMQTVGGPNYEASE